MQDINNQRRQKEEAAITKALEKEEKFKHKVEQVKKKDKSKWNTNDYHGSCCWFKRPGDSELANTKKALKARYELTCTRREEERNCLKVWEVAVVEELLELDIGEQTVV